MARPSTSSRRSFLQSSPERATSISDFLSDDRNSELNHRDALAAAHAEHDRVRETAIRVFELHGLQEEQRRILSEQQKEQERLRIEAQLVAEEKRLRALRAQKVPRLPPEPEILEPQPAHTPLPTAVNGTSKALTTTPATFKAATPPPPTTTNTNSTPSLRQLFNTPAKSSPLATPNPFKFPQTNGQASTSLPPTPNPLKSATQSANELPKNLDGSISWGSTHSKEHTPKAVQVQQAAPQPQVAAAPDRYLQIHRELKKLRKDVMEQGKFPPLKGKLGEMRRDIRKSIGQLTDVKGANSKPVSSRHQTKAKKT
jgi:nucleoporin GLE1